MGTTSHKGLVTALLSAALLVAPEWAGGQSPNVASGYIVSVNVEAVDSVHWEAAVDLVNPGPVAALTLPLRWGSGRSTLRIDSAEYRGLRTEYFALKTFRVDSTKQCVLIGLISDLGGNLPPLEPGEGTIVRLHFTTRRVRDAAPEVDTTFIPPHNVLQLVSPDVRSIRPVFHRTATTKR